MATKKAKTTKRSTTPISQHALKAATRMLSTARQHPWRRDCGVCGGDCVRVGIPSLVYRYEECSCDAAPYVHLVERMYHAECVGGTFTPVPAGDER